MKLKPVIISVLIIISTLLIISLAIDGIKILSEGMDKGMIIIKGGIER